MIPHGEHCSHCDSPVDESWGTCFVCGREIECELHDHHDFAGYPSARAAIRKARCEEVR